LLNLGNYSPCHFDRREKSPWPYVYPKFAGKRPILSKLLSLTAVSERFLGLWPRNDMRGE
jgi:hypothetical protein